MNRRCLGCGGRENVRDRRIIEERNSKGLPVKISVLPNLCWVCFHLVARLAEHRQEEMVSTD